jgi:hypothetical protein
MCVCMYNVCMYIMYVCVCVCIYVCMYVLNLYERMYVRYTKQFVYPHSAHN